jgi:predicted phosphoadenosine phosphosulfate sulfurtransferase
MLAYAFLEWEKDDIWRWLVSCEGCVRRLYDEMLRQYVLLSK